MAANIITPDDLQKFKREMLDEIEQLIKNLNGQPLKKWLKSADVRKMLGISPGTLQNIRKPIRTINVFLWILIQSLKKIKIDTAH